MVADRLEPRMVRPTRRSVMLAGVAVAVAGCTSGPELTYDDEAVPVDDDEDEPFGPDDLQSLREFVEDSNAFLLEAAETFAAWREDENAVDVETLDRLRISATALLDRYWRAIGPHEDELVQFEDGQRINGEEWEGDGAALLGALERHQRLLTVIENASIATVNAEGEHRQLSQGARDDVDRVIAEAEEVVEATDAALDGTD